MCAPGGPPQKSGSAFKSITDSLVLLVTISAFEGHQLGMLVAGIAPRSVERLPGSITALNVASRWLEIPLKLSN